MANTEEIGERLNDAKWVKTEPVGIKWHPESHDIALYFHEQPIDDWEIVIEGEEDSNLRRLFMRTAVMQPAYCRAHSLTSHPLYHHGYRSKEEIRFVWELFKHAYNRKDPWTN